MMQQAMSQQLPKQMLSLAGHLPLPLRWLIHLRGLHLKLLHFWHN
jgi:hypothetical protein